MKGSIIPQLIINQGCKGHTVHLRAATRPGVWIGEVFLDAWCRIARRGVVSMMGTPMDASMLCTQSSCEPNQESGFRTVDTRNMYSSFGELCFYLTTNRKGWFSTMEIQ